MKKMLSLFIAAAIALSLTACGKHEPPAPTNEQKQARLDFINSQRSITKENAEASAVLYRASSPRLQDLDIISHTDSTVSDSCPSGDGWASVSFMGGKVKGEKIEKYTAKCSTVSTDLGCYLDDDFKKKPQFVKQDGVCDTSLPSPLQKVKK